MRWQELPDSHAPLIEGLDIRADASEKLVMKTTGKN